jgi:hypothetical protein
LLDAGVELRERRHRSPADTGKGAAAVDRYLNRSRR